MVNATLINKSFFIYFMQERLEELNPWWKGDFELDTLPREKYFSKLKELLPKKEVVILTGIRRVGKTILIKQLIKQLLKEVPAKNILFLSLDLLYFKDYTIQDIVLEYKKMHKIQDEKVYLFLDEITYKPFFNQELKNLYDLENYKIYASSSSAKALQDKKAYLTGRARYIEIEPLDFDEYLVFRDHDKNKTSKIILEKLFEEYMQDGGMPEYVKTKNEVYLSELIEFIISKDIIAENNIKNKQIVFDLYRLLCERVGKQVSYNNLSKILSIDNETVSRYVSYFLETYLFDMIEVKDKLNVKIKSKKKLYCGDIGLRNIVTGFRDKGAIYENLVYNKIKSNYKNHLFGGINFLYKDGVEIDFVTKDFLIEAKFGQEMNEKQKKLFDDYKIKNKVVAQGVDFFLEF